MYILIRRTHLDGNRCTIVSKLPCRLIEPIVSISSSHLIVEREDHNCLFYSLVLILSLNNMLTRSKLSQCYLLICLCAYPLAIIYAIAHLCIDILSCGIAQMECSSGIILNQYLISYVDAQCCRAIAQRQRQLTVMSLSRHVCHIGHHHKVVEHRMLRFRHRQWHLYRKVTICIGGSLARKNLLAIIAVTKSTLIVIATVRPPPEGSTAHHLISHLGILNRHACITQCCTLHVYCIASLIGLLVFIKVHVECRAFVLLNTHTQRVVVYLNGEHTRQSA